MAKKKKCPEFENHERWLVAFADMMTLLFALFVVLYAIAVVNTSKVKQVKQSMQVAFGIPEEVPKEEGTIPRGPTTRDSIFRYIKGNTSREQILQKIVRERAAIIAAQAKVIEQKLAERLYGSKQFPDSASKPVDRLIYVAREPEGIRVTLLARVLFDPGAYELKKETKEMVKGVAEVLRGIGRVVRVEGHTDNVPYSSASGGIKDNWDLSVLRATSIVKLITSNSTVDAKRLTAAGHGEFFPIDNENTAQARKKNRRTEIILTPKLDELLKVLETI
jgi:chemotaxis protein MotB